MKTPAKREGKTILARMVDGKRRILMPADVEPHSTITIHRLDADTWIVRRHRPERNFKTVRIPVIEKLPDDPEWEKLELRAARHSASRLPRFRE
jgi:hypothetical protein